MKNLTHMMCCIALTACCALYSSEPSFKAPSSTLQLVTDQPPSYKQLMGMGATHEENEDIVVQQPRFQNQSTTISLDNRKALCCAIAAVVCLPKKCCGACVEGVEFAVSKEYRKKRLPVCCLCTAGSSASAAGSGIGIFNGCINAAWLPVPITCGTIAVLAALRAGTDCYSVCCKES